jgi:hypothetical protein
VENKAAFVLWRNVSVTGGKKMTDHLQWIVVFSQPPPDIRAIRILKVRDVMPLRSPQLFWDYRYSLAGDKNMALSDF